MIIDSTVFNSAKDMQNFMHNTRDKSKIKNGISFVCTYFFRDETGVTFLQVKIYQTFHALKFFGWEKVDLSPFLYRLGI